MPELEKGGEVISPEREVWRFFLFFYLVRSRDGPWNYFSIFFLDLAADAMFKDWSFCFNVILGDTVDDEIEVQDGADKNNNSIEKKTAVPGKRKANVLKG